MTKAKAKKATPNRCPICGQTYLLPKARTSPTCGNPNCIREARARGLPFASEPILPRVKLSPVIKKRKPKPVLASPGSS